MGKQADLVEQGLHKGNQVFIEGHLKLDQWTAQDGQKRSRLLVVVDNFQFLEPRADGGGTGEGGSRAPRMAPAPRRPASPAPSNYDESEPEPMEPPHTSGPGEEEIPF